MKKFLLILLLIIIAIVVTVYLSLGSIIKEAVNTFVPPITQTNVTVSSIEISPLEGELKVKGLVVGNPKGFNTQTAFILDEIEVVIDMKTIFSDTIVIKKIEIDDAVVTVDVALTGTNLGAINDNINAYLSKPNAATQPEQTKADSNKKKSKKAPKTVIIKKLNISDSRLQIASSLTNAQALVVVPLPDITMMDIGQKKEPMTFDKAFATVLSIFSQQSLRALANNTSALASDTIDALSHTGKATVNGIKSFAKDLKNTFK